MFISVIVALVISTSACARPLDSVFGIAFGLSEETVLSELQTKFDKEPRLIKMLGDAEPREDHYWSIETEICGHYAIVKWWFSDGYLSSVDIVSYWQIAYVDKCFREIVPVDSVDKFMQGYYPLYYFYHDYDRVTVVLYKPEENGHTWMKILWNRKRDGVVNY